MSKMARIRAQKCIISLISIFFTSLIFAGCSIFPKEKDVQAPPLVEPPNISYKTVKAKKGTIVKTLSSEGTFVSRKQYNAAFINRSGYLKNTYCKPGDFVKKGTLLAELDDDNILNSIKIQEIKLNMAKLDYEELVKKNSDEYSIKKAQLQVELEQAQLDNLNQELSKLKLTSNCSGKIIGQGNFKIGDYMDSSKVIYTIADVNNLQLQIKSNESANLKEGLEVDVIVGNTPCKGKVVEIANSSNNKDDKTGNSSSLTVYIDIKNIPGKVELGDKATVNSVIDKKENVILVPKECVQTYENQTFVRVLENNMKIERFVEKGISNDTEVEIISGIKEGEEIIVD